MSTEPIPGPIALTVAEVARDSGVAPSAVRFYERHGLVVAARTPGNQRRFGEDAACRIRLARVAQGVGLSVAQIRDLLEDLPPEPALDDWRRLHDALVTEAHRRIALLSETLDDITSGRKLCDL